MKKHKLHSWLRNLRNGLSATRRDFHMHPELSGQEQRTADIVADKLREYGLKVSTGVGGHGVIGLLEGKRDGPVVAWRADMDAVPGDENSGCGIVERKNRADQCFFLFSSHTASTLRL